MKRGGSLSFLVGTIGNVLVMEISWTDVGNGGYILVGYAHSNTSLNQDLSKHYTAELRGRWYSSLFLLNLHIAIIFSSRTQELLQFLVVLDQKGLSLS